MGTEAEVDGFLARYDASIEKQGRAARRLLRKTMPGAVELVYDNYNALVFAFGPSERASELILSIALYPRWVTLFFARGAMLDDPAGLLEGSGRVIRGIRLTGGAADLAKPAVRALIRQSIARAEVPLPDGRRGTTIIKAVTQKQRPRRKQR